MAIVMKRLKLAKGSFLEVGCAEGLYVNFYSKTHKQNHIVVGLDLAINYIKKAKKRCPSAMWVVGNVQNLPFKKGSFDVVLCTEVLEHLPNPRTGFHEICQVSRKQILVTAPMTPSPLFYIARDLKLSSLLGTRREIRRIWDPSSGHTFEIPMEELVMWSNNEGFQVLFLQERLYFNPPFFRVLTLFICLFKIFYSILSKIPYLRRYGPANIVLAGRST